MATRRKAGAQSEEIEAQLLTDFKAFLKPHTTMEAKKAVTGFNDRTIKNLLKRGKVMCAPYTIIRIKQLLEENTVAA